MIIGTGIDIVEIDRISRVIKKNDYFVTRFFSEAEQQYFKQRNNRAEVIAGNFAAKEAFSKAVGTGFRMFELRNIEVLRDPLGKPYINTYEGARELIKKLGIDMLHVSISHSRNYAIASVIVEKR
ncbi:MAG: holo-ACP synthase [Clostridiaceae bacterium]|nr:holo-ACP synthase [Clostridiaceae bacterium]